MLRVKDSSIPKIILFAFIAALLTFHMQAEHLDFRVDSSWVYAINILPHTNYILGKDAFFTYGPLGFLLHPTTVSNNLYISNIFWFFLRFIFAFSLFSLVINAIRLSHNNYKYYALVLYFITLIMIDNETMLILLPIVLLFFFKNAYINIFLAVLTIIFSSLIKMGPALTALGGVGTYIILYGILNKNLRIPLFATFITISLYLLIWFAITGGINSSVSYLDMSHQFVLGNDLGMSINPDNIWTLIILGIFSLSLSYFAFDNNYDFSSPNSKIMFWILILPIAAMFKYAYGREDTHIYTFVTFLMLIFLFLTVLMGNFRKCLVLTLTLVSGIICFYVNSMYVMHSSFNKLFIGIQPEFRGFEKFFKLKAINNQYKTEAIANLQPYRLPPDMLSILGYHSVDIYPYDILYAYSDHLNWQPRPIIQSYVDYTPKLDRYNALYYQKNQGPEFIIWSVPDLTVLDQYALSYEPYTILQLISNYKKVGLWNNSLLLLQKRRSPLKLEKNIIQKSTSQWNIWSSVPKISQGILLAHLQYQMSLIDKLKAMLYKLGDVYIDYKFSDGSILTYRLTLLNAPSGIWIAPFVSTISLATNFSRFQNEQAHALSSNAYVLNIDRKEIINSYLMVNGWFFIKNLPAKHVDYKLILASDATNLYMAEGNILPRPYVANYYNKLKASANSGFSFQTDISKIPLGKYQLVLQVIADGKKYMIPTQSTITIDSHGSSQVTAIRFRHDRYDLFRKNLQIVWEDINLPNSENFLVH